MPCLCLRRKFKPLKQAARNFVTCGAFNSAVATSHSSFTYTYEMADNPDTITCFPGALSAARLPHQQVSLLLCKQMTGISSPPSSLYDISLLPPDPTSLLCPESEALLWWLPTSSTITFCMEMPVKSANFCLHRTF